MQVATIDARIKAAAVVDAVIAADHQGFHHSPYDWWLFKSFITSPKTCPLCKALELTEWRGDWIPWKFPYHRHVRINMIKAMVHPNCRCRLQWAGRADYIYNVPLGFGKLWEPTGKELKELSPSQLKEVLEILRRPTGFRP